MIPTDPYKNQLEQLQKDFEEFAYIVSHDFKAPIRAISNLSSWIEEDLETGEPEDVQQNIQLLRNRAKRLESMIEALLLYSRVNRTHLEVATCNAAHVATEAAQECGGKLKLIIPAPLPTFETYRIKLKQVFQALFSNSVRFGSAPEAVVTLTCHDASDEFYEFVVADQSGGVPDEALEKIFTLFYTVSSKDNVDTTGAGLAISKKIVQFVQGTISADPNLENGLTIRFTWPKNLTKTEN